MSYGNSLFHDVAAGARLTKKAALGITKLALEAKERSQTEEFQEQKEKVSRMLGSAGDRIMDAASGIGQRINESNTFASIRSGVDSRTQQAVSCSACGAKLRSIAKFCDQCGTKLCFSEKEAPTAFQPDDFDFLNEETPNFSTADFDFLNDTPSTAQNFFADTDFDFLND